MSTERLDQQYLAIRYARAFLNTFWDNLKPEDFNALERAYLFFKNRKHARFLMNFSFLDVAVKKKALQVVRIELGFSKPFDKLMELVIDHKRSILLDQVFLALFKETQKRKNKTTFVASSVGSFDTAQKKILVEWLESKTGKTVNCLYKEDINLIAGLRLQSEQFLWEASIRARLNRIRCCLKH